MLHLQFQKFILSIDKLAVEMAFYFCKNSNNIIYLKNCSFHSAPPPASYFLSIKNDAEKEVAKMAKVKSIKFYNFVELNGSSCTTMNVRFYDINGKLILIDFSNPI